MRLVALLLLVVNAANGQSSCSPRTVTRTVIAQVPGGVSSGIGIQRTYHAIANLGPIGCVPSTGAPTNTSGTGWDVLLSNGDLGLNQCANLQFSMVPGASTNATVELQCRGEASWFKVHSVFAYTPDCKTKVLRGLVFPNGKNCSSRHRNFQPMYEMGLLPNPCGANARGQGSPANLEFASVLNIFASGIVSSGSGEIESVQVNTDIEPLRYGVQVMILDNSTQLIRSSAKVNLTLVEEDGSSSRAWRRPPIGNLGSVAAVQGVATFGIIGVTQVGLYRFLACVEGTRICATSARLYFVPASVTRIEILQQPEAGYPLALFNVTTRLASFTAQSGPVNVTTIDVFGNRGALADMSLNSVSMVMDISCRRQNTDRSLIVVTKSVSGLNLAYQEFWDLGALAEGIDARFGSGASGGSKWSCFADISLQAKNGDGTVVDTTTVPSVRTNTWTISP